MVNVLQRAVVIPQIEIIEERALGWKVFGNIAPLTARAQYIHDPVDDLAHIDFSLSPAMFGRTNQRRDVRPLLVRQIARITQLVTIVFGAVLACPHRRPLLNQAANLESHPIHPIQLLSGRTLIGVSNATLSSFKRLIETMPLKKVHVTFWKISNLKPLFRFDCGHGRTQSRRQISGASLGDHASLQRP